MTTFQKMLLALAAAGALGMGIYKGIQNSYLRGQIQTSRQEMEPLADQVRALQQDCDDTAKRLAALRLENQRLKSNLAELPRLRSELARLREQAAPANDPNDAILKEIQRRVSQLNQCLTERPEAKIPEFRFLEDSDYQDAVRSRPLDCEEAYLAALSTLRDRAELTFISDCLTPALTQYAQANQGQFPTDLAQLHPYFPSPVEDAILDRWEIASPNSALGKRYEDPIVTMKAAVDTDWDLRYVVGLTHVGSVGIDTSGHNAWGVVSPEFLAPSITAATAAYQTANNGQQPTQSQLLPYLNLTTPEQQAALEKLMKWRQPK